MRKLILLAAVLGLGLAAVLAVPAAARADVNTTVGIYTGSGFCTVGGGSDNQNPASAAGTLTVHQVDLTTVDIKYHQEEAVPFETINVYLYVAGASSCLDIIRLGSVTPNTNGVANGDFPDVTLPSGSEGVFTFAFNYPNTNEFFSSAMVPIV